MEPAHIVTQIVGLLRHAQTARLQHERKWRLNWDHYNAEKSWAGKQWWQSKANVPRVPEMVDFAANSMTLAMHLAGRWFAMEPHSQLARQPAHTSELLTRNWLESTATDLTSKMGTQTRESLLTGGAHFKLWWDQGLHVDEVDSFDYFPDPKAPRNRYVVERIMQDLDWVLWMAEQGRYDQKAAKAITVSRELDEEPQRRRRAGLGEPSQVTGRRDVELLEFWGDLIGSDGKLLARNCFAVVANRKHLLVPPTPNPFKHGLRPYIRILPKPVPHSPYGKAMVSDVRDLAMLHTELCNLAFDAAVLEAITAWEVQAEAAADPAQLALGIAPGRAYEVNPGFDWLIRPVRKDSGAAMAAISAAQFIERQTENITSLTEFIRGMPGPGAPGTATEIASKTAQSGKQLQSLSERFQHGIGRMAEMGSSLIAQYQPAHTYRTDRYKGLLGEDEALRLAAMTPDARYRYLCGRHDVQGRGVVGVFMQERQIERIMQYVNLAAQLPQLAERTNWDALGERAVQGFGWEPREILLQPEQRGALPAEPAEPLEMPGVAGAIRGMSRGGPAWQGDLEKPPSRPRMPEVAA